MERGEPLSKKSKNVAREGEIVMNAAVRRSHEGEFLSNLRMIF